MSENSETIDEKYETALNEKGYEVVKKVGQGGHSLAYKIRNEAGFSVVKISENAYVGAAAERLDKEIEVAQAVRNSPYFIGLQAVFVVNNIHYTIWDCAELGSLRDLITKDKSLTVGATCELLDSVAKGLDQIHSGKLPGFPSAIAHGDIKPENLYCFAEGFAKIGDLGIARISDSATTRKTKLYTEGYFLPKVHKASPTRERDCFGFAVTYVELRTGKHPFGEIRPKQKNQDLQKLLNNLLESKPDQSFLDKLRGEEQVILLPLLKQGANDKLPEPGGLSQLLGKLSKQSDDPGIGVEHSKAEIQPVSEVGDRMLDDSKHFAPKTVSETILHEMEAAKEDSLGVAGSSPPEENFISVDDLPNSIAEEDPNSFHHGTVKSVSKSKNQSKSDSAQAKKSKKKKDKETWAPKGNAQRRAANRMFRAYLEQLPSDQLGLSSDNEQITSYRTIAVNSNIEESCFAHIRKAQLHAYIVYRESRSNLPKSAQDPSWSEAEKLAAHRSNWISELSLATSPFPEKQAADCNVAESDQTQPKPSEARKSFADSLLVSCFFKFCYGLMVALPASLPAILLWGAVAFWRFYLEAYYQNADIGWHNNPLNPLLLLILAGYVFSRFRIFIENKEYSLYEEYWTVFNWALWATLATVAIPVISCYLWSTGSNLTAEFFVPAVDPIESKDGVLTLSSGARTGGYHTELSAVSISKDEKQVRALGAGVLVSWDLSTGKRKLIRFKELRGWFDGETLFGDSFCFKDSNGGFNLFHSSDWESFDERDASLLGFYPYSSEIKKHNNFLIAGSLHEAIADEGTEYPMIVGDDYVWQAFDRSTGKLALRIDLRKLAVDGKKFESASEPEFTSDLKRGVVRLVSSVHKTHKEISYGFLEVEWVTFDPQSCTRVDSFSLGEFEDPDRMYIDFGDGRPLIPGGHRLKKWEEVPHDRRVVMRGKGDMIAIQLRNGDLPSPKIELRRISDLSSLTVKNFQDTIGADYTLEDVSSDGLLLLLKNDRGLYVYDIEKNKFVLEKRCECLDPRFFTDDSLILARSRSRSNEVILFR